MAKPIPCSISEMLRLFSDPRDLRFISEYVLLDEEGKTIEVTICYLEMIKMVNNRGFSTNAVHAGENRKHYTGALSTPIYETSVFAFSSTRELINVMSEQKEGFVYTRFSNPTTRSVERKMAELEDTEEAAAFSSGMAAISTTILASVSSGDHIISTRDLYGGTIGLFRNVLPKLGVEVTFVETTDLEDMRGAIRKNTKVIYAETPTNPILKLLDVAGAAAIGRQKRITVVVDSTFATPYNLKPSQFGVDVVVHSATKYLGGHNDITAGVVCGNTDFIHRLVEMRKSLGGTLDPHAAWLLLRGLKTLALRMERHNSNGMAVAQYLERHNKVKKVYYPGLPNHPQNQIAKQQMIGFGGVVSFEINGDLETTIKFVDNLKLCSIAPTLGGTETLVTQPVTSSHYYVNAEDRKKAGIGDQLVRLSLGIEDEKDIIDDLERAFAMI
jgi:cystathionine beta-lyase/cystathionine gamma-synthase